MNGSISASWVFTLLVFLGFVGGGYLAYQSIATASAQRDFDRCVRQATAWGASWQMDSRVSRCNDVYAAAAGGRYGARSGGTISLASVRRPVFDIRY